ncbi:MAG: peptidylprolyl isomerase, partial [Deltaproteobacteria bacterium]
MKIPALALVAALSARASCREPPRPVETAALDHDESSSSPPPSSGGDTASTGDGGRREAPREIAARHVLVMYRGSMRNTGQTRTRDDARVRATEALRRARASEDFPALVREYSDEPGAAARGGSLGRFG